ncbi:hypothetical protein Tco_0239376 [Tanacetum coccineum]
MNKPNNIFSGVGPHLLNPENVHSRATGAATGPLAGPLVASNLTLSHSALIASSTPPRTNWLTASRVKGTSGIV